MTVNNKLPDTIQPRIDHKDASIHCPSCDAIMQPVHWHYPGGKTLFTNMFLCLDCGEYIFDKENQECMTFPRNFLTDKYISSICEECVRSDDL